MAIGVIACQPLAQPQDAREAQVALQVAPDIISRQRWIAIGIEQALLGGDYKAGAVAFNRSAFQDPVRAGIWKVGCLGQGRPCLLIAFKQVFPAPPVKAKTLCAALAFSAHDGQRPGVAQPDIAVGMSLYKHVGRHQLPCTHFSSGIAHHQPHLLAGLGHGIGESGHLFLRRREVLLPQITVRRKADPDPVLLRPFGGHEESHRFSILYPQLHSFPAARQQIHRPRSRSANRRFRQGRGQVGNRGRGPA